MTFLWTWKQKLCADKRGSKVEHAEVLTGRGSGHDLILRSLSLAAIVSRWQGQCGNLSLCPSCCVLWIFPCQALLSNASHPVCLWHFKHLLYIHLSSYWWGCLWVLLSVIPSAGIIGMLHCGDLNKNAPMGSQEAALLGGVALLEWVCHWGWIFRSPS